VRINYEDRPLELRRAGARAARHRAARLLLAAGRHALAFSVWRLFGGLAFTGVVVAVGTSANPLIQSTTPDLETTRKNYIQADPETLQTSKTSVFAGGDIVTGGATVILAMGAGRRAARAIDAYLAG
jgi:hypothetical protein